MTTHWRQRLIC